MDKNFLKYVKSKKDVAIIIVMLCLGLILILLGSREKKEETETEDGLEERIASACAVVEGVGECEVYVYYSPSESSRESDTVESVIVICQGADSADVRLRLTEMLSSFFGIGTNRVRIEKMKA